MSFRSTRCSELSSTERVLRSVMKTGCSLLMVVSEAVVVIGTASVVVIVIVEVVTDVVVVDFIEVIEVVSSSNGQLFGSQYAQALKVLSSLTFVAHQKLFFHLAHTLYSLLSDTNGKIHSVPFVVLQVVVPLVVDDKDVVGVVEVFDTVTPSKGHTSCTQ